MKDLPMEIYCHSGLDQQICHASEMTPDLYCTVLPMPECVRKENLQALLQRHWPFSLALEKMDVFPWHNPMQPQRHFALPHAEKALAPWQSRRVPKHLGSEMPCCLKSCDKQRCLQSRPCVLPVAARNLQVLHPNSQGRPHEHQWLQLPKSLTLTVRDQPPPSGRGWPHCQGLSHHYPCQSCWSANLPSLTSQRSLEPNLSSPHQSSTCKPRCTGCGCQLQSLHQSQKLYATSNLRGHKNEWPRHKCPAYIFSAMPAWATPFLEKLSHPRSPAICAWTRLSYLLLELLDGRTTWLYHNQLQICKGHRPEDHVPPTMAHCPELPTNKSHQMQCLRHPLNSLMIGAKLGELKCNTPSKSPQNSVQNALVLVDEWKCCWLNFQANAQCRQRHQLGHCQSQHPLQQSKCSLTISTWFDQRNFVWSQSAMSTMTN